VTTSRELQLPAIEIRQGRSRKLYSFAIDGKILSSIVTVSRLRRGADAMLEGYQRPEVLAHIAGIRNYLESANPILPNALVVAFDSRVRFQPSGSASTCEYSVPGDLLIPVDPTWSDDEKPGWVVDGQQRLAAVREASIRRFPVCVTAFVTDSTAEQRTQFILVNSTKPLPKGLIYELLPATQGTLPKQIRARRLPARLLERLNHDGDSPLWRRISTPTTPEGVVKDNSVLKMLENSLNDGALYYLRDSETGEGDLHAMLRVIKAYWEAVRWIFPDAFGKPPRRSRLMHGVGVVSLGFVMDAIAEGIMPSRLPEPEDFAAGLRPLAPICHWTSGTWKLGALERRWNDLQNTPRDIQLLTDFLLTEYRQRVCRSRELRIAAL
jgi:DGQHR domain-containing protein